MINKNYFLLILFFITLSIQYYNHFNIVRACTLHINTSSLKMCLQGKFKNKDNMSP
jgi:hypothetical protein